MTQVETYHVEPNLRNSKPQNFNPDHPLLDIVRILTIQIAPSLSVSPPSTLHMTGDNTSLVSIPYDLWVGLTVVRNTQTNTEINQESFLSSLIHRYMSDRINYIKLFSSLLYT